MNSWKRAAVHVGLAIFTVWPLVHVGLAAGFDLNPWKLAGWGMYAAPQIPPELRVFGAAPDEVGEYAIHDLPAAVDPVAERFLERRLGLGRLARPDAVAAALLAEWPAIAGVRIEVIEPRLDPRTGIVHDETTRYEYRRQQS